ncbi:hypothetical protein MLD38_012699 [Melastoma candidum]|uniref:Uncharacterized protein n=1 Tax=Melastoma candidum TaxID=119954 RepID=A0ACB9R770_9MYRT|nr:hypothetical protein MLD38_012699 [Melastoma candidum]
MKILLELVPCCGSPTSSRRRSTSAPSPPQDNDDTDFTSLVPPHPRRRTKRARKAVVTPRSGSSSAKWSPSLGVIAEDRAASTVQGKAAASAADVVGSARGSGGRGSMGAWSGVPDRERRRRDDNEYGRSSLPTTMIPAFTPTPFLF